MRGIKALLATILLLGLIAAGAVLAQPAAVGRSVVGGGGERVSAGNYVLNGTVGEPIVSDLVIAAGYGLSSGFWWPREYKIYLPLVLRDAS